MPKVAKNPETNRPWTRKTLRKAWIKALRSGKYEQTKGGLRNRKGFCCLGVLCDVYDPTKWVEDDDIKYLFWYEEEESNLPHYLYTFIGLNELDNRPELYELNDKFDKTFKQIANILEKGGYWEDA